MREPNTYHEHEEDPNLPDSLRVSPFSVPENYFQEMYAVQVSSLIVNKVNLANPFSVPKGYFKILSEQINTQISLPLSRDKHGFHIPENYFEDLSARIVVGIGETKLKESVNETGFVSPQGYFEEMSAQLLAQVNLERRIGTEKKDGFEVNSEYFQQLSRKVLDQINPERKVIEMPTSSPYSDEVRKSNVGWIRVLVAASVLIILSLGIFFGLNQEVTTKQQAAAAEVSLEDISDEELTSYLAMNNDGLDYIVEYITADDEGREELSVTDVADGDLEEYIKLMLE